MTTSFDERGRMRAIAICNPCTYAAVVELVAMLRGVRVRGTVDARMSVDEALTYIERFGVDACWLAAAVLNRSDP